MPHRLLNSLPAEWTTSWGVSLVAGQLATYMTPALLTEYLQAVVLFVFSVGTVLLTLEKRRDAAHRKLQREDTLAMTEAVVNLRNALADMAGQLDDVCRDRDDLWRQIAALSERVVRLACPFAKDDTARCYGADAPVPPSKEAAT
jgi:hypothetical protein